jgi:hypothetical protein
MTDAQCCICGAANAHYAWVSAGGGCFRVCRADFSKLMSQADPATRRMNAPAE